MKKLIIAFTLILLIGLLTGCGWRENLLAPPDEFTVPDGALVAECTKDNVVYKFVYKDDGVYLYYIDSLKQSEEAVDSLIEQAYLHDSSVENSFGAESGGV